MNKERTLYLHIGAHKTGTTALQRYLKMNQRYLASNGFELFLKMPNGKNAKTSNARHWVDLSGYESKFKASINHNVIHELSKGTLNTIFSSEELFWLTDKSDLQLFYKSLNKIYSKIIVICYLRRQDEQLLSHFQQGFKYPNSSALKFYGDSLLIAPQHKNYYRRYFDYHEKLEMWSSVFGLSNLLVKEYSKNKLKNNDIVADFIDILPVSLPATSVAVYENESLNSVQSIVNYNIFSVRTSLWYELGKENFTRHSTFIDSNKPQSSKEYNEYILDIYAESNHKLTEYIPNLSTNWYKPSNACSSSNRAEEYSRDEFEKALKGIIEYYDQLSLFQLIRLKIKKWFKSSIFINNVRHYLSI